MCYELQYCVTGFSIFVWGNYKELCAYCGCSNGVEGEDWKRIGAASSSVLCYSLTMQDEFCGHEFVWGSSTCYCRAYDADLCDQTSYPYSDWNVYEIEIVVGKLIQMFHVF